MIFLTARQDDFTHFEPSQSLGGTKTGDPREKPTDHPQAELGLSHMTRARLEPTAVRLRAFRALKIGGLDHSATAAVNKSITLV